MSAGKADQFESLTFEELDQRCRELYRQLRASEAECERLRREVEDVRKLDLWQSTIGREIWTDLFEHDDEGFTLNLSDEFGEEVEFGEASFPAARRAAVKYLEKESKGG